MALDKKKIQHIAVAGNIGAGKTVLTKILAKHFNWQPQFEEVEHNPYLSDFYDDMQRWSFNLQIFFLNSRYRQIVNIRKGTQTIIQDRTIHEDAHIFAPNLYEMGLMTQRDYENYFSLFELMIKQVSPPDLLIYLKADIPTLVSRIEKRGREYEGTISIDYLKRLNERYDNWINIYREGKLLIIPTDKLDFTENKEDLSFVIDKVTAEINGLF